MNANEILTATRDVMQELMGPDYEAHGIAISSKGANLRVSGLVTRGHTVSFGYDVIDIARVDTDLLRRVLAKPAGEIRAQYVPAAKPGEAA